MSGFGTSIAEEISRLEGVKGELDNVLSAALQQVAQRFKDVASAPLIWPMYATDGLRKEQGGPSLRKNQVVPYKKTTPARKGVPHSINRWSMVKLGTGWSVFNPAEYASYIHDNKPEGNLVRRQLLPVLDFIEEENIGLVRGAVLRAFEDAV